MPAIPLGHLPQTTGAGKEHLSGHFFCPSSISFLYGLTDLTKLIIKYVKRCKSDNIFGKYGLFVPLFIGFVNTLARKILRFFTP
jgi:hypothetical protein